ncbi:ras GEF [Auricularia subglabra TFB-10046 SS5]|nr:ras GEF [Auricularia subglabra TFB-10046 SS5]
MTSRYVDPIERIQRMMMVGLQHHPARSLAHSDYQKVDPHTRPLWDYEKEIAPETRLDHLDAIQVASEFTVLHSELYRRVTREECLTILVTGPSGALAEILDVEKKIKRWVLKSILDLDNLWLRAAVMDRWISIAHVRPIQCRKLQNFATALVIMQALCWNGIQDLRETRGQIYGHVPFREMVELFDPTDDHARIRAHIETLTGWHPTVPCTDVYRFRFPDEAFIAQYLRRQQYEHNNPDPNYVPNVVPEYGLRRRKFIAAHIQNRLAATTEVDDDWYGQRAEELVEAEAAIVWDTPADA